MVAFSPHRAPSRGPASHRQERYTGPSCLYPEHASPLQHPDTDWNIGCAPDRAGGRNLSRSCAGVCPNRKHTPPAHATKRFLAGALLFDTVAKNAKKSGLKIDSTLFQEWRSPGDASVSQPRVNSLLGKRPARESRTDAAVVDRSGSESSASDAEAEEGSPQKPMHVGMSDSDED